jgi:hypothetical protein
MTGDALDRLLKETRLRNVWPALGGEIWHDRGAQRTPS